MMFIEKITQLRSLDELNKIIFTVSAIQLDFPEYDLIDNWCTLHEFERKSLFQGKNNHDDCFYAVNL